MSLPIPEKWLANHAHILERREGKRKCEQRCILESIATLANLDPKLVFLQKGEDVSVAKDAFLYATVIYEEESGDVEEADLLILSNPDEDPLLSVFSVKVGGHIICYDCTLIAEEIWRKYGNHFHLVAALEASEGEISMDENDLTRHFSPERKDDTELSNLLRKIFFVFKRIA